MCVAISECARVDEAKDIRDKALALEAYYRQARNLDAEREAANVRLRAERRVGELLRELERASVPNPAGLGGRSGKVVTSDQTTQQSPYAAALEAQGMSRQAAGRFQALADIPEEEFERVLSAPERLSTSALLKRRVPAPLDELPVSDAALMIWGLLRDIERSGFFQTEPKPISATMTDAIRADVSRLLPPVMDLFCSLREELAR